jgi:RNA polymerase sigma factor (sigma-70 family)
MTPQSFEALHKQYSGRVLCRLITLTRNPTEAEDIAASAFVSAYRKRRTFRGESSFYTWLTAIAFNEFRSRARRKRLLSLDRFVKDDSGMPFEPDLLDQTLDRVECCRRLRQTLRRLPAKFRRVLVDHGVRGHSMKRIAKAQRIPVGTALSRNFTAKRLLRAAWEV